MMTTDILPRHPPPPPPPKQPACLKCTGWTRTGDPRRLPRALGKPCPRAQQALRPSALAVGDPPRLPPVLRAPCGLWRLWPVGSKCFPYLFSLRNPNTRAGSARPAPLGAQCAPHTHAPTHPRSRHGQGQAAPRPAEAGGAAGRERHRARRHGAEEGQGGPQGVRGGGGPDVLRLPVPAAARPAAAGPGHRRDRGGLPHGEHQPLPASQRHSILGWDHCKHRVCFA